MDASAFARRSLERARGLATSPFTLSAVLVAALGWQVAGLTWAALPAAPPAAPPDAPAALPGDRDPATESAPPAERVAQLHLFGRPPAPEPAAEVASAPETKLNLLLKGIYAQGGGAGAAVITAGDGAEQVYAVGDTVAGEAHITGIFPDRVLLRRDGQPEVLRMPGDEPLPGAPAARRERAQPGDAQQDA